MTPVLRGGRSKIFSRLAPFAFQRTLAERRIPVHYDEQDYEDDVRTLRELGRA